MRAVRNTTDGISVTEQPAVEPGLGRVRVRVRAAGICGSDLHLVEWGPMPVTLGHEFAGLLDDGTPVAVQPQTPCLTCDRCLAGDDHLCRTLLDRTHGVSIDGGLADEVLVDPRAVVVLPAGVGIDDASLVEPVAVAVHGLHRAAVEAGERVLIIGGGSIGLCAVAVAGHLGAAADLVARHPHQVTAGERLGAGRVRVRVRAADLVARHSHQVTAGEQLGATTTLTDEYDVVIDAAGTPEAVDQAFGRVRPGGTVLELATFWSPVQVGLAMTTNEVRFVASTGYGHHDDEREFELAADVLAQVPELPAALITHRFGLDDAAEAFRVAGDRSGGAIKVHLAP